MIREQIKARGIKDPYVLKAMSAIPREKFIPLDQRHEAYYDGSLPIGASQTISQPYIVALMIQILALTEDSKVLEIGTGSGYNAAVLAHIAKEVYTVEIIPTLHLEAKSRLERMGFTNIHLLLRDGHRGWSEHAPYDGIIFTAAVKEIPQAIFDQLKLNAILIAPVGDKGVQTLMKYRKGMYGNIYKEEITPVRFVRMFSFDGRDA